MIHSSRIEETHYDVGGFDCCRRKWKDPDVEKHYRTLERRVIAGEATPEERKEFFAMSDEFWEGYPTRETLPEHRWSTSQTDIRAYGPCGYVPDVGARVKSIKQKLGLDNTEKK